MELIDEAVATVPAPAAVPTMAPKMESQPHCFRPPSSLPYSKKKFFFSQAERSFYEILRGITPDHTVFAKVRLCDVISVSTRSKTWTKDYDRTRSKRLDFLICDATLTPVMAIELGDSLHARTEHKVHDQFVDPALA